MGVMLERVQNKFACIIGELCGEPDVLSEFAIWLDLRLAEYKSKGMISLECSGETPDPSWLRGHKDKRAKMSQHIERQDQFDSRGSQYNEDLPDEVVERLSPDVPLVKEELTEQSDIVPVGVYRHQSSSQQRDVKVNHGRKRSFTNTSAVAKTSHSDHPYKVQRLSQSPSDSDVEPANQSLMSIIKDSRSVEDSEEVSGNVSVEYSNVNTPDNGNNSTVVPSTSSVDSAERLDGDDAVTQSADPVSLPRKRKKYAKYTTAEKQTILAEAELGSFRTAAAKYQVPVSTIATWKKALATEHADSSFTRGRPLTYSAKTDQKIVSWALCRRDLHLPVSQRALTDFATRLIVSETPGFKASNGWIRQFLRRNNLSTKMKTSLNQKLPADLNDRLIAFRKQLREIREELGFDMRMVINMDQVPMYFHDFASRGMMHVKRKKDVRISTAGAEKCHLSVVLAATATGAKLPPMLIFKGKQPMNLTVPEGCLVRVNSTGWMTEELMFDWLQHVLSPYTEGRPTLLVMDSFSANVAASVETMCGELHVTTAVIPEGCTSHAQPLDVGITKPFKDRLRSIWVGSICRKVKETNQCPKPSKQEMADWVMKSWSSIPADLVVKSFKVTGISSALDRSEDGTLDDEKVITEFLDDSGEEEDSFLDEDIPVSREDPFLNGSDSDMD